MRHEYPTSVETRRALRGIVKAVADKWQVTRAYLDAILNDYKTDPYPVFRALFEATAKVAPSRCHIWLNDLHMIVRVESARANQATSAPGRFTGEPRELRRQTREAVDAAIDDRPVDEQMLETAEAIESMEARLLKLAEMREAQREGRKVPR